MFTRFICLLCALLCAGSALADPVTPDALGLSAAPPRPSMALSLAQTVALAARQAPQVQAGRYQQKAAAADSDRAGRLPDPQLQFGVQNLDTQGSGAFNPNADAMTMRFVGISQDIPSAAVRTAQQAGAQAGQEAAAAATQVNQFEAKRSAAAAWVNVWTAQQVEQVLARLAEQNRIAVRAAQAQLSAATGSVTDVLAARAAGIDLDNQLEAIHGDDQEAQATLARWIGSEAARIPLADPPDFSILPIKVSNLSQSVDLQAPMLGWDARVHAAEASLQRAEAGKQPDWNIGAGYGLRAPGLPALASLQVGVRLPLFAEHRQDQDIDARHADLEAVRAEHEDARRAQIESVARLLARWRSLNAQVTRDEHSLLPVTHDRAVTALAAYRSGGALQPWLDAYRTEIDTRLSYANLLATRALAWVELAYLLPEDAQ